MPFQCTIRICRRCNTNFTATHPNRYLCDSCRTPTCPECGQLFVPTRARQTCCSYGCRSAAKMRPLAERFWPKVDQSGGPNACWLWIGALSDNGYGDHYGIIGLGGRDAGQDYAHRVSWRLAHPTEPIPAGYYVCHNCPGGDNPTCVNPRHLWLGTNAANQDDMVTKDRHWLQRHPDRVLRGEQNGVARLTVAAVRAIRQQYAGGTITLAQLATEYGVGRTTVARVIHRTTWQHVTP